MNNKTSVYDKENFFALYQKLRSNPISLNEIVEKPTMLSLLPDLQGKKLLDLGCGTGGHLQLYLERGADKSDWNRSFRKNARTSRKRFTKVRSIFWMFFVISTTDGKIVRIARK